MRTLLREPKKNLIFSQELSVRIILVSFYFVAYIVAPRKGEKCQNLSKNIKKCNSFELHFYYWIALPTVLVMLFCSVFKVLYNDFGILEFPAS